ncbi:MAG: PAS domain S-box protein [Desulfobacterales bacterium]|nr:MAG: PAS domain S-box protein [Desulfobacterales bacterium]
MAGKSINEHFDAKSYEPVTYRRRTTEGSELEREERKLAIKLLRRRDEILKAVHLFTERFLRMPLTESSVEPILEILGHAAEVSRVYIFENHTLQDGTQATSQRYEWVAPGIVSQLANTDLQNLPWLEAGFKRWVDTLSRRELIYGHVSEFPEVERKILAAQNIISIMVAPIFVGENWWGFIGFDDCRTAREWSPVEIEALKTAANVLGAAIQRKKAEDALMESEKKYRLVVDNANEGIIIAQDGMIKFVNPQISEFTGREDQALKASSFLDYVHPDDREMVIEHHRKRLAGEEIPRAYFFRMIDQNGDVRWIRNNGVIVEWEGRPATLNFLLDSTERKKAADALAESEEKYRQLFENESDAVMIFDAQTLRFEDANPATLNLLGYSKDEFLVLKVEDISAEKDKTRISVKKVITDDTESAHVPLRWFKRKDGTVFPGEISAGKFFAGGRKKIIGAVRDITERMQAEEKIRALTQQLIKAQENERNLIAGYLHDDVAQDLSSLKIGLETLYDRGQEVTPEIKVKICELSKILQESITAVRDLSYDLRPPGMDQLGLVRTVYQYCDDFSEKNNVDVDLYTAGMKDLKLDFDTEINLYRLIQEGLNNIKKHADADKVVIRLVASSPNIILRIEDNGKGFDVEQRMARSLKEKRMGLSSMEERVSLLGGSMKIKSRLSKGTRIFIEVPCGVRKDD